MKVTHFRKNGNVNIVYKTGFLQTPHGKQREGEYDFFPVSPRYSTFQIWKGIPLPFIFTLLQIVLCYLLSVYDTNTYTLYDYILLSV